ncbi:MAG TPA: hypothetical protein VFZ68_08790 [Acidimicrobiales bacterium]
MRAAALVAAAASAAFTGCGDDSDDSNGAQPVPGATAFEEGVFDDLPRYPGSVAVSDPAIEDDVTSQTFTVEAPTPQRVISYFARELDEAGWTVVEEPTQRGAEQTHRGVWQREGERLVVSTTLFRSADEAGADPITQYSLSLGPAPEP